MIKAFDISPGFVVMPEVVDILNKYECDVHATGSRVICDPAPTDTDADFLVETSAEKFSLIFNDLDKLGFKCETDDEHYKDASKTTFVSMRHGQLNLLITTNDDFAHRHRVATKVCKKLNLLNKDDRVMIFQAVLYANFEEINEDDIGF